MSFPIFIRWSLLLFFYCLSSPVIGQENKTIRLVELLNSLKEQYQASFSFNHSLLNNLVMPAPEGPATMKKTLAYIEQHASVRFKASGEKEFLIVPVRSEAVFKVVESSTGEPIPMVYLQINQQSKKYFFPKDSNYLIPNLFPTDSLTIESRFHEPVRISVAELSKLNGILTLSPSTVKLEEVVIMGFMTSGINSKLSDHSLQVDMKDLSLLAGETDGDILQLLKAIPGIRTPDGKPGSLNMRGNTFSQNLVYFDDIPIYHKGHFFGTFSPFNAGVVDKVKIHLGALPAQWGGRVGGLIDIRTDNKVPESIGAGILANTVYSAFQFKVPLVKNKLGVHFSVRSSYPFDQLSPKLQEFSELNFQGSRIEPLVSGNDENRGNIDVAFSDINGKLVYNLNKDHTATLGFIRIVNDFDYLFNSPRRDLIETQTSDLDNWGITGSWNGKLSPSLAANFGISTSSLKIFEKNTELEAGNLTRFDEIINTIDDLRIVSSLTYVLSQKTKLKFGYELVNQQLKFEEERSDGPPSRDTNTSAVTQSIYGNVEQKWLDKWIVNIGLRGDHYSPLEVVYIDPRISLSYLATNELSLKSSVGRSHQYIKQNLEGDFDDFRVNNQFWYLADNNTPVLEGWQGMIGTTFEQSNWVLDLELYSKKTTGITQNLNGEPGPLNEGALSTIGADFFVKRRWASFETWASYSLSRNQSDFETKTLTYFDQTHVVNLTFLLDLKRWDIALSWNYLSGMPVIEPDIGPGNNPNAPTSLDIPYTGRFPSQHQLDLSLTYSLWPADHKLKGVVGLSMLNLYDRRNIINIFQEDVSEDNLFRRAVGFAPNIQVSISF